MARPGAPTPAGHALLPLSPKRASFATSSALLPAAAQSCGMIRTVSFITLGGFLTSLNPGGVGTAAEGLTSHTFSQIRPEGRREKPMSLAPEAS